MSVSAYLVLFPHGAREKRMWVDWKNVCACAIVFMFSCSAREKSMGMDWKNVYLCASHQLSCGGIKHPADVVECPNQIQLPSLN